MMASPRRQHSRRKQMAKLTRTLKIKKADHFLAQPTTLSHLWVIDKIREKLTETQYQMFRKTCFGHFLDLQALKFSGNLVHHVLLHEVQKESVENELWFLVQNTPIRFSRMEFGLITGLNFGHYPQELGGSTRLRETYFDGSPVITFKDIDLAYDRLDFTTVDNMDAVKLSLFFFVERLLFGRPTRHRSDPWVLELVDDLDKFNSYPWGSVAWDRTYQNLRKVLTGQAEKFKNKKANREMSGEEWKHAAYNLEGFPIAFQLWIYEAIPSAGTYFAVCNNTRLPRMLRWKSTKKNIRIRDIYKHIFDLKLPKLDVMLEPSFEEKELPYVVQLEAIILSEGEYRGNLVVEPLVDDVNDDEDCSTVSTKAGKYARERQVPQGPLHDDYGGRMPQGSSHDIDGKQMPGGPSNDVNGGLLNSEIFCELRSLRTDFETFMRRQDEVETFMRRQDEALKNFMDEVHGWMHSFGIASGSNSGQVKPCDTCGHIGFVEQIVTCHQCKSAREHVYCMRVVLFSIPEVWFCEECRSS